MSNDVIGGPRGSGRTTKLIQHILDWMAEHEGKVVIVAGPDERWASMIKYAFQGAVDVEIYNPAKHQEALEGRGRDTLIAVDNLDLIRTNDRLGLMDYLPAFEHTVVVIET